MRAVLELVPITNFGVAAAGERSDQMESLARVLMGLSHPLQLIASARETDTEYEWTTPPRLSRRWLAVVTADDVGTLTWRTRTLKNALEGVGLRCEVLRDLSEANNAQATDVESSEISTVSHTACAYDTRMGRCWAA